MQYQTGTVLHLDGCKIRHIKHTPSLPIQTAAAVCADPSLSSHLTFLYFADSHNYHANTTGNAITGFKWRKTPGALSKEEVAGIITRVMECTNRGDY